MEETGSPEQAEIGVGRVTTVTRANSNGCSNDLLRPQVNP
jgi:hypothetical protein